MRCVMGATMFYGCIVRFTNLDDYDNPEPWLYQRTEQFALPLLHVFEPQSQAGAWGCTVDGKPFRTTSAHHLYHQNLVPW
jgi:hypothetical protein